MLNIQTFKTRQQMHNAAHYHIAALLSEILCTDPKVSLFLSGGSTPGPVYKRLSHTKLPWDQVNIGLVDERWVSEKSIGSNAALIRENLLTNDATSAVFTTMKTKHETSLKGQKQVEKLYAPLFKHKSLAILGMGTDGHVCSWFPNSTGLEAALDPANHNYVQSIQARKTKVTGDYLDRMTLSFSAINSCKSIILLITGEEKKTVLDRVIKGHTPELPVAHLLKLAPAQLTILQAP